MVVKHSSPAGDLLALMPSFREIYRKTGSKVTVLQQLNVVGEGHPGITQPYTNKNGQSIMMGDSMFKKLRPLIESQDYIECFNEYKGQIIDYDLDEIRLKTFTNQPYGSMHRWAWYAFPEMSCNLSENWLHFMNDKEPLDKVLVNFTPRYRNSWMNYYFLKEYQDRLLFVGLLKERDDFCEKWLLDIPLHETNDFKELALDISRCKFYFGNQTGFFQIAEGIGKHRLLETCREIPHVIPFTPNGYDAYHQQAMEFYFKKLIKG